MRLPPVIRAAVFFRFRRGGGGRIGRRTKSRRRTGAAVSSPSGLSCPSSLSVAERAEERRSLVRVAPLGAERRSGEQVLIRDAHCRFVHRCKRMEPLHGAAGGF